jgi:hypothetical protein
MMLSTGQEIFKLIVREVAHGAARYYEAQLHLFERITEQWLPKPRISHPWPNQSAEQRSLR